MNLIISAIVDLLEIELVIELAMVIAGVLVSLRAKIRFL